jgi:sulfotransferase famil protein
MIFNRKPNFKRPLFLHIQKTAGSSIVRLARSEYGSNEVVSHGDFLEGCTVQDLDEIVNSKGREPEFFSNKTFVSGHFGYEYAKVLMPDRYSFTFLRDPVERILSYYYFCLTRDPQQYEIYALTQKLTLDEFLELGFEHPGVKACIWNNQAWQLACGYGNSDGRGISSFSSEEILKLAVRHLKDFSYIGFTETFEEDRDNIFEDIGMEVPKKKIVANANPGRPIAKDLPYSTLNLLDELTRLDKVLYKKAWALKNSFFRKIIRKGRRLLSQRDKKLE